MHARRQRIDGEAETNGGHLGDDRKRVEESAAPTIHSGSPLRECRRDDWRANGLRMR